MVLRKTKQLSEESIDELLPQFDQLDCRIETPWAELSTLQEVIERSDLREQVKAGIGQLPPSYRIVVQLRDKEDYACVANVASIWPRINESWKLRKSNFLSPKSGWVMPFPKILLRPFWKRETRSLVARKTSLVLRSALY